MQPTGNPVRMAVRVFDLDTNGHVRGPIYLEFADHARWECVRAAGISLDDLAAAGFGPVNLETTIKFHRELRPGDEVLITTEFLYGEGKTSRVRQEMHRLDGTLVAEVTSVSGLLDRTTRRLVANPAAHWRQYAKAPEHLGL
ncbi:thioesterase family protein [Fodinicola feengrottensis]